MPILGLLGTLIIAGIFFYIRNRGTVGAIEDVVEIAGEARRAPRRMKFKRQANIHPVQQCEHPEELVAGFASAFIELDGLPRSETQNASIAALGREYRLTTGDAEELLTYGRWLMNECGSPDQAITRIGKRIYKLDGAGSFQPLMSVLNDAAIAAGGLSDRQSDALAELKKAFRIS